MRKGMITMAGAILVGSLFPSLGAAEKEGSPGPLSGTWELVTEKAAFSPRDTAEDIVFADKMWLSNGYYHGNVLHRDLWNTKDGKTWTLVSAATPYPGYSEMTVYNGKMWAVKASVWTSSDGAKWTQVAKKTPFGTRGYGELVVQGGKMWQLGSGADVWHTNDGVTWERVCRKAPYGRRNGAAVTVYDGNFWLMGGSTPGAADPPEKGYKTITTHNDVWCSPDGETWECVLKHAPWGRRKWVIAAVYAEHMWIIGGYDNVHGANFGDAWYTKDGKTWHEFKSEPMWSSRHEATVYVFDGSLWVVAGNHWPVTNDVWRLTLPRK